MTKIIKIKRDYTISFFGRVLYVNNHIAKHMLKQGLATSKKDSYQLTMSKKGVDVLKKQLLNIN